MTSPPFDIPSTRVGRVRAPSAAEVADDANLVRGDAVVAIARALAPLPEREQVLANLIDGFRPVARLRSKFGLSNEDFVATFDALRARGLLQLVGIVEAGEEVRPYVALDVELTVPKASGDTIPVHVMQEIAAMLQEAEAQRRFVPVSDCDFDDEKTEEMRIPET